MPTFETCQGCGCRLVIVEDEAANYAKCPECGTVVLIQGSVIGTDPSARASSKGLDESAPPAE
jgi:transcription initiation factor TFIIIB Brf1 subunit/transcription initiation factor TFIIB